MTTVAEALEVLEGAASTRRAQTAFSALKSEIDAIGSHQSSSGKPPRFPDAKDVAEDGDDEKRQGQTTAGDGQGPATARKGS